MGEQTTLLIAREQKEIGREQCPMVSVMTWGSLTRHHLKNDSLPFNVTDLATRPSMHVSFCSMYLSDSKHFDQKFC